MKKNVFLGLCCLTLSAQAQTTQTPPVAKIHPTELKEFGGTRIDNYFYMRLSDAQKQATTYDEQTREVREYLEAENAYCAAYQAPLKDLTATLHKELTSRLTPDDKSVPYEKNGYTYATEYATGKDYPIYTRTRVGSNTPEVLLDVNPLAEGHKYCGVNAPTVSPDNRLMAYGVDYVSRRIYTLHLVDLTTGKAFDEQLEGTEGRAVWSADSKYIYYIAKDIPTLRAEKVMRHKLGTPQSQDEMLFDETDETFSIHVSKTSDDQYIVATSNQTLTTQSFYIKADDNTGKLRPFTSRVVNHRYNLDHMNGRFYILTNKDNSLNRKLMVMDDKDLGTEQWQDYIAYRPDVMIEGFALFNNYLVLNERANGLRTLRIKALNGNRDEYLKFDEPCYTTSLDRNENPASPWLRYQYQSMLTPQQIIDLNLETGEKIIRKNTEVPTYNAEKYQMERIWAIAKDGTRVPVDVITPKGFKKDGTAPLFLYAYGSYGNSTDPTFNSNVFSLLDRGFAYAIAHIRGGSDMGRQWYEDGKLMKKMNTFTDFNDCAHFLIQEKYAASDKVFASGRSAGGLLMGACINLEPELYKGVIATVPFVDVVTTMRDESIPLTTFEWDEWGDPRKEDYYRYMLSYSPYDNVGAKNYPNLMVYTGFWDSQVQYWEPTKWVAKLRANKTGNNVIIFRCDMSAGHGGASGRFKRLEQTAEEYAFMLNLLK